MNKTSKNAQIGKIARAAAVAAAAAVVVLAGFSQLALGQYQIDGGRVRDANNRLGSSGNNDSRPTVYGPSGNQVVTGNQIITGNVTAGRQFRGFVPYTDPSALRVPTAGGGMDSFIKNSNGAPSPYTESKANPNQAQPFYGVGRDVAPPAGFVRQDFTGAYVPAPANTAPLSSDTRVGVTHNLLPRPGELALPGPLDPSAGIGVVGQPGAIGNNGFLNSPMAGPRVGGTADPLGEQSLNRTLNKAGLPDSRLGGDMSNAPLGSRSDVNVAANYRAGGGTQSGTQALGQTLGGTQTPGVTNRNVQGAAGTAGAAGNGANATLAGGALNSGTLTADQSLTAGAITSTPITAGSRGSGATPGSEMATGAGMYQRMVSTPSPETAATGTNTQYAEMQRRYNRFVQERKAVAMNDMERNRQFQAQKRAADALEAAKRTSVAANDKTESRMPTREDLNLKPIGRESQELASGAGNAAQLQEGQRTARAQGYVPSVPRMEPLEIPSLAAGTKNGPTAEVLANAEKLMKQGKFTTALEEYEKAARMDPANPLVSLGRANAELGASYYARAEKDLRDAFSADPALLAGKYNVQQFLGAERLDFLMRDLRDIATSEPRESRAPFLLAYLTYNTGNARAAAEYLDQAERRAGKPDSVYRLIRENWQLPEIAPQVAPE